MQQAESGTILAFFHDDLLAIDLSQTCVFVDKSTPAAGVSKARQREMTVSLAGVTFADEPVTPQPMQGFTVNGGVFLIGQDATGKTDFSKTWKLSVPDMVVSTVHLVDPPPPLFCTVTSSSDRVETPSDLLWITPPEFQGPISSPIDFSGGLLWGVIDVAAKRVSLRAGSSLLKPSVPYEFKAVMPAHAVVAPVIGTKAPADTIGGLSIVSLPAELEPTDEADDDTDKPQNDDDN